MNDHPPSCPACGAPLPHNRLDGLCPACAWKGLWDIAEEATPVPFEAGVLMRLPGYEVLSEIARGGMGVVYRARQSNPSRTVALKMLLPHQLGSAGMAERFRLEVRALSELDHPAILPVYHVGEHDGLPFFTMKLAAGGTLSQRLGRFAGDWQAIAQLVADLADAVQFAHEHGVLHRDLKPGNILFDEQGRGYVSDFGLAKLTNAQLELTQPAEFLGTPHYVAPEVADGSAHQATTASDIYSLGAILYELLTGRRPFEDERVTVLLRKIAEEEPVPPGKVQSNRPADSRPAESQRGPANRPSPVPRDLEVICLKCLAKEPPRRYTTAGELSRDLRRWLAGEPITARPVSSFERLGKWVRRNPILATLTMALVLSLLGGSIGLWQSYRKVSTALERTRQAEGRAQDNLSDALLAQSQALGAARATGQRWQALKGLGHAARIRPTPELRNEAAAALARTDLRERLRIPATFGDAGSSAVFTSDLERYITPEPEGGFALYSTRDKAPLRRYPGIKGQPARWFVLSQDDRYVAALQDDYTMEIWPLEAMEPQCRWPGTVRQPAVAEFHPDGKSVAGFVTGEGLFLQKLEGGERTRLSPPTNARAIFLRFDPKGERLAVVRDPGGVELWRCAPAPSVLWTQPMHQTVPWLAWSPDGKKLAAAANDGRGLRIFSAEDGQTELVYSRHLLYARQFEFAPDGRVVASLGEDWSLRLWDSTTGQDLVTGVGRHRVMRFSRDGWRLATAPTDHELAVLDLAPEHVFREFKGTSMGPHFTGNGLACSGDGRWLAVATPQMRLYDARRGEEVAVLNLRPAIAQNVFFDATSTAILYSTFGQGTFRRVLCPTNNQTASSSFHWGNEELIAAHPQAIIWSTVQGGTNWVCHTYTNVEIWPQHDPSQAHRIPAHGRLENVTTSQDAKWVAVSEPAQNRVAIREVASGRTLTNLPARMPDRVWFSPDSSWLVASVVSGYTTWETGSWRPGASWDARLESADPGEVTFSEDSRLIAARQERETFRLLTFPECREWVTLKPPLVVPVRNACLSSDGNRLWLLAAGCRVFEWNLAELRSELAKLGLQ